MTAQDKLAKKKQTTTASETPTLERTTVFEGSDDALRIYANNVSIRSSTYDFRLSFGEVIDATEEELRIREKAVVFMSPQHAKVTAGILAQHVNAYEEQYGKLPGKTIIEVHERDDD